jgi:hypothetical protein
MPFDLKIAAAAGPAKYCTNAFAACASAAAAWTLAEN